MADAVHAPGHVIDEEDAHKPAPEKSRPSTESKRNREAECNPERSETINRHHGAIFEEMWGVLLNLWKTCLGKKPPKMRMPEAFERAMRIPFIIRVCVMLDVRRCPVRWAPLECHRTKDQEECAKRNVGRKPFMREHPVIPDGDPEYGETVEDCEENKVERKNVLLPEESECSDHSDNRKSDEEKNLHSVERFGHG